MSIDWSATGDMLSGVGSIASSAAVLIAAAMASNTLKSWKRQKVAERKFDHAERTLAASYRAREALAHIRSSLVHGHETYTARVELEAEDSWEARGVEERARFLTAQVIINRMKDTDAAFQELADCIPVAKALFGDDLEDALRQLHRQRWIVRTYVDAYADGQGDSEWLTAVRSEMWAPMHQPTGKVSEAVATSIAAIEGVCLRALRV